MGPTAFLLTHGRDTVGYKVLKKVFALGEILPAKYKESIMVFADHLTKAEFYLFLQCYWDYFFPHCLRGSESIQEKNECKNQ